MSFSSDFRTLCLSPEVKALMSEASFTFGKAARGTKAPYVVCAEIGNKPQFTNDENTPGASRLDRRLVQVTIYGNTREEAVAVEEAIRAAVENDATLRGQVEDGRDDYDDLLDLDGRILTISAWPRIDVLP